MGFCSNLGARGLFSSLTGFLLGAYWLAGSRSPDGGRDPTISRETETQVPAICQPQPRQPHIIKLISQLQKPTRKITDTWIIDTGKRETRYQLVKVHQTIRRPHISMCFLKSFKNTSDKMTLIPSSFSRVIFLVLFYSWDHLIPSGENGFLILPLPYWFITKSFISIDNSFPQNSSFWVRS